MEKFILNRDDCVFLIIDIQERLARVMEDRDRVVENTSILLQMSKAMDIPVIITEQYPKGLGNTLEVIKELSHDAKVFEKNSFSGYIEEVKEELEKLNRNKIIISGMETHVCVLQTSRDLIRAGYDVHIIKDAVASRTPSNYENALDLIREMGGVISNTETVVFDLLKKAGSSEFKSISKLIK